MSKLPTNRSAFIKHWQSRLNVLQAVINGLSGNPFDWSYSSGATDAYRKLLKEFDITLIAESSLKKHGLQLVRGAKPVGRVAYGAPVSNSGYVYVKECQTRPISEADHDH